MTTFTYALTTDTQPITDFITTVLPSDLLPSADDDQQLLTIDLIIDLLTHYATDAHDDTDDDFFNDSYELLHLLSAAADAPDQLTFQTQLNRIITDFLTNS